MIVDASALLAIVLEEAEGDRFMVALAGAPEPLMSAVNYVEAAIRFDGLPPEVTSGLDAFIRSSGISVQPVTVRQARLAREAYATFARAGTRRG